MLYELRQYAVTPGKVDALHARFREHTFPLFERHGFDVIGYWAETPEPESIVYLLRFRDRAHLDEAWAAFRGDPDWQEAKARTERDGPLVQHVSSTLLEPTEISPSP